MARNYQIGEAVEIIANGEDAEALQDIGRRYPLLLAKVAKATSGENADAVVELFKYTPDYLSANKVNKDIKIAYGLIEGKTRDDDADADDDADEKPAKKAPAKKKTAAKKAGSPYDGMSAIDLFKECKKRGLKPAPKKSVKYYTDMLKKADAEAVEAEEADDDWGDEEEEETTKKKAPAKKGRPAKKKPEPEPEDDDDDDDDWDI